MDILLNERYSLLCGPSYHLAHRRRKLLVGNLFHLLKLEVANQRPFPIFELIHEVSEVFSKNLLLWFYLFRPFRSVKFLGFRLERLKVFIFGAMQTIRIFRVP
jgi:hypothetical protein